jgi:hypothetical protein
VSLQKGGNNPKSESPNNSSCKNRRQKGNEKKGDQAEKKLASGTREREQEDEDEERKRKRKRKRRRRNPLTLSKSTIKTSSKGNLFTSLIFELKTPITKGMGAQQ